METALMTQKDGLIAKANLSIANGMLKEAIIVKNMEVIMKMMGR